MAKSEVPWPLLGVAAVGGVVYWATRPRAHVTPGPAVSTAGGPPFSTGSTRVPTADDVTQYRFSSGLNTLGALPLTLAAALYSLRVTSSPTVAPGVGFQVSLAPALTWIAQQLGRTIDLNSTTIEALVRLVTDYYVTKRPSLRAYPVALRQADIDSLNREVREIDPRFPLLQARAL